MSYRQVIIPGPFKGIVDNLPRPNKPLNAFDDVLNFLIRKGRIQTRPRLNAFGAPPDGAIVRNMVTFRDVMNNYHTLALTTQHAYALTAGPTYNALTLPTINSVVITSLSGTSLPYAINVLTSKAFFTNGSKCLMYADGSSTIKAAGTDVNADGFSARFLGTLAGHQIAADTTEPPPGVGGSTRYPFRVRWSQAGSGVNWTTPSGGFNDLIEVPDSIAGFASLGRNGYVFRSNGITVMAPSGNGAAPFIFEQMSNSIQGVGVEYPYSLATYGSFCVFVSKADIYVFDGTSLNPIGGEAKKKIFTDLEQASGDEVVGFILPRFGVGFDYLSYWLSIPGVNVSWVFSYDDQSWTRFTSSAGRLTALNTVAVG